MSLDALNQFHREIGGVVREDGCILRYFEDPEIEYRAVREGIGIFNYTHHNIFSFKGEGAVTYLNSMLTGNIEFLEFCRILFTALLDNQGKLIDLLYVFRTMEGFLIMGSGQQREKVLGMFKDHLPADVELIDENGKYAVISLEGVYSWELAKNIAGADVVGLRYLSFFETSFQKIPNMICARCGITGEYGFRFVLPLEGALDFSRYLANFSTNHPKEFCGIEILDILSQEVRFPVFDCGISEGDNPIEMGLNWMIDLKKESFLGKEAIDRALNGEAKLRMVGFICSDRCDAIQPKQPVFIEDELIGEVVMSAYSYRLKVTIGYVLLNQEWACVGIEAYTIKAAEQSIRIKTVPTAFFLTESIKVQMV